MTARSMHRIHLALPLGLTGLIGACLTADFYRLRLAGDGRGILLLLIPPAGALLGIVLSHRAIARRRWATWFAAVLGTILLGMAVAVGVSVVVWSVSYMGSIVVQGALTSLAFLPAVILMTRLARRVGRARAGSLVDEADRRAPWVVIAVGTALAQPVVGHGVSSAYSSYYGGSVEMSAGLGALAVAALASMFVIDLVVAVRARRAIFATLGMRPRAPGLETSCDDVVDLGIGDDEYEELAPGGSAYRTNERPVRIVRGDPQAAFTVLRAAALRSALCAVLALGTVAVSSGSLHAPVNSLLYGRFY